MLAVARSLVRPAVRVFDPLIAFATMIAAPFIFLICRAGKDAPLTRAVLDRLGMSVIRHHYYEPVIRPADIRKPLTEERALPGVDLNEAGQLALLDAFQYGDELRAIPDKKPAVDQFGYVNGRYGPGDAEMLYNVVRHFKPKRIVEVGSGQSTLLAKMAADANRRERPESDCRITCVEPFEQPWLEQTGVEVIRERIEDCDDDLVLSLEAGDIFFIDSSHVVRPQGDVLHLFQHLLPRLAPGVLIHVHDVFVPRDYPAKWVIEDRRLWNEQYLLEAFLACNAEFEVVLAVNWLANHHRDRLGEAAPKLLEKPDQQPGAFWIRRKQNRAA